MTAEPEHICNGLAITRFFYGWNYPAKLHAYLEADRLNISLANADMGYFTFHCLDAKTIVNGVKNTNGQFRQNFKRTDPYILIGTFDGRNGLAAYSEGPDKYIIETIYFEFILFPEGASVKIFGAMKEYKDWELLEEKDKWKPYAIFFDIQIDNLDKLFGNEPETAPFKEDFFAFSYNFYTSLSA